MKNDFEFSDSLFHAYQNIDRATGRFMRGRITYDELKLHEEAFHRQRSVVREGAGIRPRSLLEKTKRTRDLRSTHRRRMPLR